MNSHTVYSVTSYSVCINWLSLLRIFQGESWWWLTLQKWKKNFLTIRWGKWNFSYLYIDTISFFATLLLLLLYSWLVFLHSSKLVFNLKSFIHSLVIVEMEGWWWMKDPLIMSTRLICVFRSMVTKRGFLKVLLLFS